MNLKLLFKTAANWSRQNAPLLCAVGSGLGTVTTAALMHRSDLRATMLLEDKYKCYIDEVIEETTVIQRTKDTWKCYILPTISGGLTIAAIIGGHKINTGRIAAISAAAAMSERALKEFTAKTVEHIGERKTQKIADSVVQDKVINDPVTNKEVYITNKGETLFYDTMSGRYFKHDIESVKRAINELNKDLIDDMYVSLNDFYYAIGLKGTELGGNLGWNIQKEGLIDVAFVAQKADNEEPCLALSYTVTPRYNYGELY